MADETTGANRVMRSEQRIPRLRSRGRENRRRLLATAEKLLAEPGNETLRVSDVFEAAGVSRGSAYRIYIGIDDLMHDLAAEWINNFVDYLATNEPPEPPEDWMTLSDFIVERGVAYWKNTEKTLKVMPRIRSNVPESHKRAQRALSRVIGEIFARCAATGGSARSGPPRRRPCAAPISRSTFPRGCRGAATRRPVRPDAKLRSPRAAGPTTQRFEYCQ